MNHTANLHLPQWEKTDRIMMDDFNDAMEKIDAAVTADKLYFGSYVGDGQKNRIIQLPFAPRLMIVFGHYVNGGYVGRRLGLLTQDIGYCTGDSGWTLSSADLGGILSGDQYQLGRFEFWNNEADMTVYYVAVK